MLVPSDQSQSISSSVNKLLSVGEDQAKLDTGVMPATAKVIVIAILTWRNAFTLHQRSLNSGNYDRCPVRPD
jgi:hypothetical protein